MSIEGLVSVSAIFHDKAGDDSLKVVSLASSEAYTSGKVAIVEGTLGTSTITIECSPTNPEYRDAAGNVVSVSVLSRVAFQSDRPVQVNGALGHGRIVESDGGVSISRYVSSGGFGQGPSVELDPGYTAGSCSYSIVFIGE